VSDGFLSPIGRTTGSGQVTGIIGKAFYDAGRLDALEAAREAVAALPMMKIAGNFPLYDADDVIAAIDALLAKADNQRLSEDHDD
jgi:hypothetical protein